MIELLLVVVIMGVVVGVVLPAFSLVTRQGVRTGLDLGVGRLQRVVASGKLRGGEFFYFNEGVVGISNGINRSELGVVDNFFVKLTYRDRSKECIHLMGNKHNDKFCYKVGEELVVDKDGKVLLFEIDGSGKIYNMRKEKGGLVKKEIGVITFNMGNGDIVYETSLSGITGISLEREGEMSDGEK